MRKTSGVEAGHALKAGTVFLPCLLCRAPVDITTAAARDGLSLCDRHEDMCRIASAIDAARLEFWTVTAPGIELATDFYFSREEAEAALEDARRRDSWHPEDAAVQARLRVERIELDDLTPSEN